MATQERKHQETEATKSRGTGKQDSPRSSPSRGLTPQRDQSEPLQQIRDEFDRLFDRFMGSAWPGLRSLGGASRLRESGQASDYWGLDIDETDDAVVVRADAPGFEPDDFDLQVRGNQLVLCGQHHEQATENNRSAWCDREICRVVTLPAEVKAEDVDAHYQHGVLTVKLAKTTPTASRRIEVKG